VTDYYPQQKFSLSGRHVDDESLSAATSPIDLTQRALHVARVRHPVDVGFHHVTCHRRCLEKLL